MSVAARFTVEDYHRMIQAGVLTEDDAVELLEGWLVRKIAGNPPHDTSLAKTGKALARRIAEGWTLRNQSAVTTQDSEPEPDLAVARGTDDDYASRHPEAQDVLLVVEVADSSLLDADRRDKARIYARAGIAVHWIVNCVDQTVEVYTDPSGAVELPSYRQRNTYSIGQSVPFSLTGGSPVEIPVAEFFPSPPAA